MIFSPIPGDAENAGQLSIPAAHCEVVASAVLRAARTSARLTEAALAVGGAAAEVTVRAWETGSQPLTTVSAPQLEHLKSTLLDAGAEPQIVADLDAAAWCDLVVLAIAIALLAIFLDVPQVLVVVLTALGGAGALLAGFLLWIGHISVEDLNQGAVAGVIRDSWFWFVIYLVIAIAGIFVQVASSQEYRLERTAYQYY